MFYAFEILERFYDIFDGHADYHRRAKTRQRVVSVVFSAYGEQVQIGYVFTFIVNFTVRNVRAVHFFFRRKVNDFPSRFFVEISDQRIVVTKHRVFGFGQVCQNFAFDVDVIVHIVMP